MFTLMLMKNFLLNIKIEIYFFSIKVFNCQKGMAQIVQWISRSCFPGVWRQTLAWRGWPLFCTMMNWWETHHWDIVGRSVGLRCCCGIRGTRAPLRNGIPFWRWWWCTRTRCWSHSTVPHVHCLASNGSHQSCPQQIGTDCCKCFWNCLFSTPSNGNRASVSKILFKEKKNRNHQIVNQIQ